jgi:intergrase/recombinase
MLAEKLHQLHKRLNIPESVTDFIQGRVPKSIEAKH